MGLSQKEMAERLRVSYATVNRLEGGRFKPSADTLERFYSLDSAIASSAQSANVLDDLSSIIEGSRNAAIRAVNVTLCNIAATEPPARKARIRRDAKWRKG